MIDERFDNLTRFIRSAKNRFALYAERPSASITLYVFALVESCFLPLSPDFLLIPLSVARPKRSFWYATICIAGSVCGGVIGYHIGAFLFESFGLSVLTTFGWTEGFQSVLLKFRENAWEALVFAGFVPIPFAVFTYAAGFNHTIEFGVFAMAILAGRCLRFYFVASLLYIFGPSVQTLIDRYLLRATILVSAVLVLWIVITGLLMN